MHAFWRQISGSPVFTFVDNFLSTLRGGGVVGCPLNRLYKEEEAELPRNLVGWPRMSET